MKFVFFGYDFAINTVHRLIEDGHELIGIHTFPCDNIFNFNTKLAQLASSLNIPITEQKPNAADIGNWLAKGAELFLAAGYLYKIPAIDETKAFAINIHPSRLPKGRGIMPLPHIIMHAHYAAGMTAHKITNQYDGGDILAQIPLTLSADETVETLSSRIAMAMPDMASSLIRNLPERWKLAQPQNEKEVTIFPAPSDAMRTIDFTLPVATIKTLHRAFGTFGILFTLNNELWVAYTLNGWEEEHNRAPGSLQHLTAREIIIAASNGYICVTQADKLSN
jgi:methionyl-tRNA formyltransferase